MSLPEFPNVEGPREAPAAETEAAAGPAEDGYQIKLDFFEGPLDLLLFLIK